MNPANAARRANPARRTVLILAAAAASVTAEIGCATGESWRAGAGAMSSMLWSRATAPTQPGYDLYAQNMAQSKSVKDAEALASASDRHPGLDGGEPVDEEPVAADQSTAAAIAESRPRHRGTSDESVRVTLGRPESLPVLRDPDGSPGPLLASAAPTTTPAVPPSVAPRPFEAAPEADIASAPPELAAAEADPTPEPRPAHAVEVEAAPAPELAQSEPVEEPRARSAEPSLKSILDEAQERLEAMSTYQVSITRIERVGNQVLPEEKALLSIRRNPKAVRLEWPEGANKGREVIYSAAINERMMHVNVGNSAIPIPRMSLPVDSPLALRNSRHAITEAGFDTIFKNLAKQVDAQGRPTGAEGRLTYKGLQKPQDVDHACHLIQRITPAKEVWRVYLDPESLMPVVVTAHQADGGLLESYRYEGLKTDPTELASADAFDPDKRWGEAKGLFSRFARAAAGGSDSAAPTTQR
ncbi:DUF1571 domain-containing protein [Paludisphaera soli]|uniref:DUF1571 domain-containing protein n=1 Tax=Paludisphaera soli TaxID=2712865 RepID=UPI0013EC5050|nr:DUF1571 domain-containing protein [Paludisphaera soli]